MRGQLASPRKEHPTRRWARHNIPLAQRSVIAVSPPRGDLRARHHGSSSIAVGTGHRPDNHATRSRTSSVRCTRSGTVANSTATPTRRSPPASRTARSPGRDRRGAPQPPATAAPGWRWWASGRRRATRSAATRPPRCGPIPAPAGAGQRPGRQRCQPRTAVPLRRSRRLAAPAAGVTRYILSPQRSPEPPDVSVGVTRQMRQHVRNRPPGQPARRANLLVGDVLHPRDQPRVCGPAQLDRRSGISVQITRHSLQPPTRVTHVPSAIHSASWQPGFLGSRRTERCGRHAARRVGRKVAQASGTLTVSI